MLKESTPYVLMITRYIQSILENNVCLSVQEILGAKKSSISRPSQKFWTSNQNIVLEVNVLDKKPKTLDLDELYAIDKDKTLYQD